MKLLSFITSHLSTASVCVRIIKTIRENKQNNEDSSDALNRYCSLGSILGTEEQRFCYNIDNIRSELGRMLGLGADEMRVCKKVYATNAHFCEVKAQKKPTTAERRSNRDARKRGVIYE